LKSKLLDTELKDLLLGGFFIGLKGNVTEFIYDTKKPLLSRG